MHQHIFELIHLRTFIESSTLFIMQAIVVFGSQDIELAIKGEFNAVLDTIGIQETERVGINLLKKGGHYMTLQVTYLTFLKYNQLDLFSPFSLSHCDKSELV